MSIRALMIVAAIASTATASAEVENAREVVNLGNGREVVTWNDREVVQSELLVQFIENTPAFAQRNLHQMLGYAVIENISPVLALLRIPENGLDQAIEAYSVHGDVRFAQPNFIERPTYIPNDTSWNQQYGPEQIHAPEAWDVYQNDPSTDVIISIIDTGINTSHLDLDDNFVYGYDYLDGDSNPNDSYGHGTHCSGISAAETDNNRGIAGVSFGAPYAAYRCGNGGLPTDALVNAINDSTSRGFHVFSMSWGSSGPNNAITIALEAAYATGVVPIAAAGNNGDTRKFYPAANDVVLSVAATNSSDQKAGFSTYGDWVDVAAPGQDVYATWIGGSNAYTSISGTSMACPHVSGMAGFLYSRMGGVRSVENRNRIMDLITSTSEDRTYVKFGRVNMEDALALLDAGGGDGEHPIPPGDCDRPTHYGSGTPGTGGLVPNTVQSSYATLGNNAWSLNISDAASSAPAALFIGFTSASDNSGGYLRLVNPVIIIPTATNSSGEVNIGLSIPNNPFLFNLSLYIQAVITDGGAANGIAASDGYHVTLCHDD